MKFTLANTYKKLKTFFRKEQSSNFSTADSFLRSKRTISNFNIYEILDTYENNAVVRNVIDKINNTISGFDFVYSIDGDMETKSCMDLKYSLEEGNGKAGFKEVLSQAMLYYLLLNRVYFNFEVSHRGNSINFDVINPTYLNENLSSYDLKNISVTQGKYTGIYDSSNFIDNDILNIYGNSNRYNGLGNSKILGIYDFILTFNAIADFSQDLVNNGSNQSILLTPSNERSKLFSQNLEKTKEYTQKLQSYLKSKNGGAKVISDLVNVNKTGQTLQDMDFKNLLNECIKNICNTFHTPALLYTGEGTTFANQGEANKSFIYEACLPLVNKFLNKISNYLTQKTKRKISIEVNLLSIKNLQADREKEITSYTNLYNSGLITGNEVRKKIGLEDLDELDSIKNPFDFKGTDFEDDAMEEKEEIFNKGKK